MLSFSSISHIVRNTTIDLHLFNHLGNMLTSIATYIESLLFNYATTTMYRPH